MDEHPLLIRLHALADRSRLMMLQMMAKGAIGSCCNRIEAYENGCCVADVVAVTGLAQPTVSHHLKVLERAGLVRKQLRGTWACYFPDPDAVDELLEHLRATLHPVQADDGQPPCCP